MFCQFQILVWAIIPNLSDSVTSHPRIVLWFTIILQYFLRLALIYPLSSQIVNSSGVMTTEKAWVGAAYNMTLYIMASHVSDKIKLNECILVDFLFHFLRQDFSRISGFGKSFQGQFTIC